MHLDPKKSILHLVISLDTGGLERFVLDLIAVNNNMFNQIVVCLERTGELAHNSSVKVISLNMQPGLHLGITKEIIKIIRNYNIDILHTHNEKAQFYGGIAGFLASVPVVHTKHGRNSHDIRTLLRNNLTARFCRKVVAVSRDAALECIQVEKIPSSKVQTILNGVDTVHFSPGKSQKEFKTRLGLSEKCLVIGIVARLAPVKDHTTLFNACKILKVSVPDFKLLVVGDGQLRDQLESLAQKLNLNDQIIFTGMREDIPSLMRAMDIFVLSSISEGISLTLLEAMACCLPIVATAVGGNPEVIVAGKTGYLVDVRSPELLAEKLEVLILNKQLRNIMGEAGRSRVVESFSLKACAAEYQRLYSSIMSRL
ncbi:MAG: glycosyltransferase [Desulfuromonadaceae bacterium]